MIKIGQAVIRLPVDDEDIEEGICGNRRQCAISRSYKRNLGVPSEHCYITTDENGLAVSHGGTRYLYRLPKTAKRWAKMFDQDKDSVTPTVITAYLTETYPTAPPATRARKDQVNTARKNRDALRKTAGEPRKLYDRFV